MDFLLFLHLLNEHITHQIVLFLIWSVRLACFPMISNGLKLLSRTTNIFNVLG